MTHRESLDTDEIYVSRVRKDHSVSNGIGMWIVCNNLRRGAALNIVQILETLSCIHLSNGDKATKEPNIITHNALQ